MYGALKLEYSRLKYWERSGVVEGWNGVEWWRGRVDWSGVKWWRAESSGVVEG